MKLIATIIVLFLTSCPSVFSQEWAWMNGTQNLNNPPVWGVQGVSNPGNTPGGRMGAASWIDNNGNFWLFGGWCNVNGTKYLNDLWKYSPVTKQWTFMKGTPAFNGSGVYGTKGVAAVLNKPSARRYSSSWKDNAGNLWLYGGNHQFNSGFGDLWKYEIATNLWTWISGENIAGTEPTYGVQGIPDPGNAPGARAAAAAWTDANGDFWLFSGNINNRDDLWKYSVATNQWTWVKGNKIQVGVYATGNFGDSTVPNPSNLPGSRFHPTTWVDNSGDLWMFGGWGSFRIPSSTLPTSARDRNDLWKYNIATNEWTWMHGDSSANGTAVYGTKGVPDPANKPGPRSFAGVWKDSTGKVWLFGGWKLLGNGAFYNDSWIFDPVTNRWVWVNGDNVPGGGAVYGIRDVANFQNIPGATGISTSWTDSAGNFWFFGGGTANTQNQISFRDEIWKLSFCKPVNDLISPDSISICNGSSHLLTISGGGSYQWNLSGNPIPGAVNSTYSAANPGVYSVDIINGTCWRSASNMSTVKVVSLPSTNLNPAFSSICPGEGQLLTATGSATTYQWSKDGNIIPGAVSQTYMATVSGSYSVLPFNGSCQGYSGNSAIIATKPAPVTSITPASAEICTGDSVSLLAYGSGSFQWKLNGIDIAGATGSVYYAGQAGKYSVVLTSNGCSSLSINDAMVTVKQQPQSNVTPIDGMVCPGFPVLLTVTGSGSYQWTLNNQIIPGATNKVLPVTLPGIYQVSLRDGNCIGKSNVSIITSGTVKRGARYEPLFLVAGKSYTLQPKRVGHSYSWQPSIGLDNPFVSNPTTIATVDRVYYVSIASPGMCTVVDTLEVKVFPASLVYVPTAFTPNGDGKNDLFRPIPIQMKSFSYFKIFNRWGELIFHTTKEGDGWNGSFKGKLAPQGIYVWIFAGYNDENNKILSQGTFTLIR